MDTALVCSLHAADLGVLSVSRMRNPLGRVARRRLLKHKIDLLQAQTLGLGDKEVGEEYAGGAGRSPDEEHLGLQVAIFFVHEVRRNEANNKVP
jgi:hypothetical protein